MAAKRSQRAANLRRQQLDRQLRRIDIAALRPPPGGWIRSLRVALGMNGRQLAERIGVSRGHLSHMEQAEESMAITMQSLSRAAEALNCHLVYALVPKAGSLQELLETRAREVATSMVDRIAASMALEAQATDGESREQLIDSTAAELVRSLDKSLWDGAP